MIIMLIGIVHSKSQSTV